VPTITLPSYLYHCESDELTPGIRVCRVSGVGETYSPRTLGAWVCALCGEPLVLDSRAPKPATVARVAQQDSLL
jgi:hypothetical protein